MQKKSFLKLLLSALGYMIMGNLLATVMTFSLAPFRGETLIVAMTMVFAAAIYILLVAVPDNKDGLEQYTKSQKNKNTENDKNQKKSKYRWLLIGVILFCVMNVSIIALLLGQIGWYRVFNGATLQMTLLIKRQYIPFINIGFYALTVPACHIGFILGLGDKLNKDKVMYK